jgi:hypothetical protein
MDVVHWQVFPDEPSDARIALYGFVSPIRVHREAGPLTTKYVAYKRLGDTWDKGNITVKYGHGVGRSHWEGGVPECAKG